MGISSEIGPLIVGSLVFMLFIAPFVLALALLSHGVKRKSYVHFGAGIGLLLLSWFFLLPFFFGKN